MGHMAVALEDYHRAFEHPEHPEPPRIRQPRRNPKQTFGISVRLFRKRHNLSLEDVSRDTAIDEAVLEDLENGEDTKTLTIRDMRNIARISLCDLRINQLKSSRYRTRTLLDNIFARGGRPRLIATHPITR